MPTGAVIRKLIHRIWTAVKGCPPAMFNRVATRNVTMYVTSATSMKRMYLSMLS